MKIFQPKLISSLKTYSKSQLANDIIAGIIVAIIALPLSIALAIASGVEPQQGLYTAVIAGFFVALCGGSRVNITGPTAAFATIVAGVVATQGMSGLIIATLLAGVFLILMGICRFGSLIKYIPMTITTGFTAGIAVTIVVGQIKDFLGLTFAPGTHAIETGEKVMAVAKSITTITPQAVAVGGIGLGILILWPKLGKLNKGKFSLICGKIPPSIIAVIVGILLLQIPVFEKVNTIGSLYVIPKGIPEFDFPTFSWDTVVAVLPNAATIAVLAAIESLLSCVVSDGMIGDRHNSNTELIALGMGNICSGLFGGIPATGAIARTAANVKNGGRTPISGMIHALVLLLFLLVFMPLAAMIPMPIIAAILFMVAYNMSEWRHFVHICRFSAPGDVLVLVATFVLTVVFDLVVAIAVGLILAALLFLKQMSDVTYVRRWDGKDKDDPHAKEIPDGTVVYEINGPMFFADADKFLDFSLEKDTKVVLLRMSNVPSIDATAMKNLEILLHVCKTTGVTLLLSHPQAPARKVMEKAGFVEKVGEDNIFPTIDDALARATELCQG